MILDTSALVAILTDEQEAAHFLREVTQAPAPSLSAATLVEATLVLEGRFGPQMGQDLDDLLRRMRVDVVPVTADQAQIAREGWRRYGKGRHKAALNLGDLFAYALARERDEPLLFKGDDFARTDVKRAL